MSVDCCEKNRNLRILTFIYVSTYTYVCVCYKFATKNIKHPWGRLSVSLGKILLSVKAKGLECWEMEWGGFMA